MTRRRSGGSTEGKEKRRNRKTQRGIGKTGLSSDRYQYLIQRQIIVRVEVLVPLDQPTYGRGGVQAESARYQTALITAERNKQHTENSRPLDKNS